MKRYVILSCLIGLPACSGDDSNPNNGTGNDASTFDGTAADDVGPVEDTGASPDVGTAGHDAGHDAGADADAAAPTDAADAGPESDASDAAPDAGGCPTTWYVAPVVDPSIAVPDGGGGVLLHAIGTGTQNYVCTPANDAGAWVLQTPEATLSDCHAAVIGHHFASEAGAGFPEWQTTDGTYVIGTKRAPFSPDGGAGSIPWLLIGAVDAGGTGTLSSTQYVQRLDTDGGLAPAGACALDAGTVKVPYTADYYFYGP
jgi:hypothetical protein